MNEELIKRIEKIEQWIEQKKSNQISNPLDEMSKNNLGAPIYIGTGSFGTQIVGVVAGAVTVPAQPSGTIKVNINGTIRELLYK